MDSSLNPIAVWAHGFAAVVFVAFAVYLGLGWRGGRLGGRVLAAVVLSALWAVSEFAAEAWVPQLHAWRVPVLLDFARLVAWVFFLAGLLREASVRQPGSDSMVSLGALLLLIAGAVSLWSSPEPGVTRDQAMARLLLTIWFLVMVEQVYRNFPQGSRWGIKPMAIALASAFAFDLYLYADAAMLGRFDEDVGAIRVAVFAVTLPLIAMSAVRSRDWTFRITVSRELVFHTTSLAATGLYLLLIAAAGYYVRWFGGSWGKALQTALMVCGLMLLVFLVFSGSVRARLRVLIDKHLFAYRYDYRNSWLRFTQALTDASAEYSLEQRAIKALADLVESPGGVLWVRGEDGRFRPRAQLNQHPGEWVEEGDSPACRLMRERGWILNLEEWRSRASLYEGELPSWAQNATDAWLTVPLASGGELTGFVQLASSRVPVDVNWEVLDLLRTAGAQAASYLNLAHTTEALLEAKKFDSFNRMSAFVVHDLKNLVSQLSLMLKNADRHKSNPEFQDDMLMTVANAADRMRGLMQQLQNKTSIEQKRPLDLGAACRTVQRLAGEGTASLALQLEDGVQVNAHADRLERIIGHVVQNALEATPEHGKVEVCLRVRDGWAELTISDNGCGMSQEFIRERLFRPFQTTKHTGMGIGTYEVQQYVNELGGRVAVESEPGAGSCFTIRLPLAVRAEPMAA